MEKNEPTYTQVKLNQTTKEKLTRIRSAAGEINITDGIRTAIDMSFVFIDALSKGEEIYFMDRSGKLKNVIFPSLHLNGNSD